jgi:hypothetical protein
MTRTSDAMAMARLSAMPLLKVKIRVYFRSMTSLLRRTVCRLHDPNIVYAHSTVDKPNGNESEEFRCLARSEMQVQL